MEHYQKELEDRNKKNEKKKKKMLQGTGPLGSLVITLIESIFLMIKMLINMLVDIASDGFDFAFNMFFSDFKGFLVKGIQEKKGICFDLMIFRTVLTIMVPPVGVFLARGISGWYNILLCAFFCLFKYIPGVLYAFIVIHNARYSNLYHQFKKRKRELRDGKKSKRGVIGGVDLIPIIVFAICLMIGVSLVLLSSKYSPTIETDWAFIKDKLNMIGIGNTSKINNIVHVAETGDLSPIVKFNLLGKK
jgi:uncharacterized membrane protein YqaE (UPF0057 family)